MYKFYISIPTWAQDDGTRGSVTEVIGECFIVDNGVLQIADNDDNAVMVFAAGMWTRFWYENV